MQQVEQTRGLGGAERKRVEAVVETLATLGSKGETVAEVAHDARNMVTALGLYCDLLEEPGVLATPFLHYGNELRLVAAASHRLVEKLVALDTHASPGGAGSRAGLLNLGQMPMDALVRDRLEEGRLGQDRLDRDRLDRGGLDRGKLDQNQPDRARRWDLMPAEPIDNLAAELLATRNLLAALAGPSIVLTVDVEGCAKPVWLTGEDLTRVLVNLVKNAAEAMPAGGRIQLGLRERPSEPGTEPGAAASLTLTIEDHPCARFFSKGRLAGRASRAGSVHHAIGDQGRGRADSRRKSPPGGSAPGDRTACPDPLKPGRSSGSPVADERRQHG